MSQVYLGVSSTPSVPTTFTADTGTANPSSNNINFFTDQSEAYNLDGIDSIASGSTVTHRLTNRVYGAGSTTGATTIDLVTFSLGATPGVYRFFASGVNFDSATPAGAGYRLEVTARTTGAAGTLIGSVLAPQEEAALSAASLTGVVVGNNLIIRALGVAGLTINWSVSALYERVF